jgi:hypothetical protein
MGTPRTLEDLLDLEALRQLKTRYVYALDGCRHDELRALFADDAAIEIDGDRFAVDAFIAMVTKAYAGIRALHRISAPLIDLLSDDEARGMWTFTSVVIGPEVTVRETGYYRETYRKDEAGWRIASMILTHEIVHRESEPLVQYPTDIVVPL